jgi:hypothetical protein
MGVLLKSCRNLTDLKRLHAAAIAANDTAGAFFLETNADDLLAQQPGREQLSNQADLEAWHAVGREQRTRRAGAPYQRVMADEAELAETLTEVNSHLTSFEASATAQALGLEDSAQFQSGAPIANLHLPAADPIFD